MQETIKKQFQKKHTKMAQASNNLPCRGDGLTVLLGIEKIVKKHIKEV